jgi:hypothetical protein
MSPCERDCKRRRRIEELRNMERGRFFMIEEEEEEEDQIYFLPIRK